MKPCPLFFDVFEKAQYVVHIRTADVPLFMYRDRDALASLTGFTSGKDSIFSSEQIDVSVRSSSVRSAPLRFSSVTPRVNYSATNINRRDAEKRNIWIRAFLYPLDTTKSK
jgi:hypothetical protein